LVQTKPVSFGSELHTIIAMARGLLIGLLQVILIAGVAGTNLHDKAFPEDEY
jgi:hypothetical protein